MFRTLSRLVALGGVVLGSAALAQPPQGLMPLPRITSVFPMGAQSGTEVELVINGSDLDDGEKLLFSHPGITAQVILPPEPKEDPKNAKKKPPAKKKAAAITSVKFKVKVAKEVPVGSYDVRLVNQFGVSNPRAFLVGERPELVELEPNDDAILPEPPKGPDGKPGAKPTGPQAQRVNLGTVIHGVISAPTDVDYSVFFAKAGERVLISAQTESIDSKARPLVEVYDLNGKRLALNRNYAGNDALCDVRIPADGDYFIRVSEFAYQQGGADYFYRLTIGVSPWIDAVFPNVLNPGKPTPVTVYGRGLPGGQPTDLKTMDGKPLEKLSTTITPPSDPASRYQMNLKSLVSPMLGLMDGFEFRLPSPTGRSNPLPIFLTDAPIHLEKDGDNDKIESAEAVPVPCDVVGRISKRYDRDYYSFNGKKGEVLQIDLYGDRLGSPCDLYLRVRNDKNQELAGDNDDDNDSLHPTAFFTRTIDPKPIKFTVPYDGKIFILVGSNDSNVSYGPRAGYRLRVSQAKPDFRAVVMDRNRNYPSVAVANSEGETAVDVFIDRRDGFEGPVTVTAKNLPAGITAQPCVIGTGMRWGTLVFSAQGGLKNAEGPITVECSATIDGKPVVRDARSACITWGLAQPNIPVVTRLTNDLMFATRAEKATFRLTADLSKATVKTKDDKGKETDVKLATPIFAKPGDKITVPMAVKWQDSVARPNALKLQIEATQQNMQNAPVTVNNGQPINLDKAKNDSPIIIDVKPNAPPGEYAVVLQGETQIQYVRDPEQKDKKTPATVQAYSLPIKVTVLPASLAKVTVQPGPMKLGTKGELTIKIERLADYSGEFQVSVVLPANTKGIKAMPAKLPAGQNELKLSVDIAKDANAGNLQNVLVQVTGTVHQKFPIMTETKFNLNITK